MIKWVNQVRSIRDTLLRQRISEGEEMRFPSMSRVKGREVLIKQVRNGFLLAFDPQEEDQWLRDVVFCETFEQISTEVTRFFSKKALTNP